ncbi:MAG: START-like domain-containing protein [Ignavibacteriaceae bacterium]|jgi:uncharacterized protein YndB with AHSA1/START domain|nr:START-like domain-containing protein [Ignavibacteriaceae bacterium]
MNTVEQINLEYSINTIPKILFYRLSDPSGLEEWFADEVILKDDIYTFKWEKSEQQAQLLENKPEKYIRFRWLDAHEESYFEFSIHTQELTGDVALKITDFVDEDEKEDIIRMWNEQIDNLKHTLGLI